MKLTWPHSGARRRVQGIIDDARRQTRLATRQQVARWDAAGTVPSLAARDKDSQSQEPLQLQPPAQSTHTATHGEHGAGARGTNASAMPDNISSADEHDSATDDRDADPGATWSVEW